MLIFIYGPDTYRSRQKLKEIIENYQKIRKSGLNLRVMDFEETDFLKFFDEFRQQAMFGEKKLFVLKNSFSNIQFKEKFLKEKKCFIETDDILVFFEESKILKSDRLAKFLEKNAKTQEFPLLSGQKLKNWIEREFKERKTTITRLALEKFLQFLGNDTWRLVNEADKLSNYKKGGVVEEKDINLLVRPDVEAEIFDTIGALARREKFLAIKLVAKHLGKGESPFYILSMINFQFRNILLAKTGAIYSTKVHPFVLRKSIELSSNFSLEELKKIYRKIFSADIGSKTGKFSPEEGIKMIVAEV